MYNNETGGDGASASATLAELGIFAIICNFFAGEMGYRMPSDTPIQNPDFR